MSDDDYLTPGEVRPGMRVEIVQRPWQGVVTTPVSQAGTFLAFRDGPGTERETSWSFDSIGSIRLLRQAPTLGETAVSRYQDELNDGESHAGAFSSTVAWLVSTYSDAADLAVAVRALQAYAEERTP